MAARFPIRSGGYRPGGGRGLVTRPTEFTCFSYDDNHEFKQDASGLRWYYHNPMDIGADLSAGFERFDKHDDSQPEHLVGLLRSIVDYEKKEGRRIDAHLVTWRGMMTKILSCPFEYRDGFEMNATVFQNCLFIEENHEFKMESKRRQSQQRRRGRFTPEQMTFWGYKFETLTTLPRPWGESTRTEIESRPEATVSNKAQYCSIVTMHLGRTKLCLAGEIDALWGSKPTDPSHPTDWVELKTSADIQSDRDLSFFNNKAMRFWIQSYLIGVSRVVVGFRSHDGRLVRVKEMYTADLPGVSPRDWDADVCVDFAVEFLEWLKGVIRGDGVWRIRRQAGGHDIEVFKVAEHGHGEVLTEEFISWRNSDAMKNPGQPGQPQQQAQEQAQQQPSS